jgi:hypothetical protein
MKCATELHDRPHHVYRVFDARGLLLYIGCTREVGSRMAVHRAWGNPSPASFAIKLYGAKVETETYPSFDTARAAEREAIANEAPYFNREHNPRRWRRVDGEWVASEEYEPAKPSAEDMRLTQELLEHLCGPS